MVLPWFSSQASQDPLRPNPSSKEGPAAAQQAAPALRAKCRSSGTLAAASAACVRQIWMGDGHIIGILTKGSTINDHPIYGTLLVYPTIDDGSNGHGKIGKIDKVWIFGHAKRSNKAIWQWKVIEMRICPDVIFRTNCCWYNFWVWLVFTHRRYRQLVIRRLNQISQRKWQLHGIVWVGYSDGTPHFGSVLVWGKALDSSFLGFP